MFSNDGSFENGPQWPTFVQYRPWSHITIAITPSTELFSPPYILTETVRTSIVIWKYGLKQYKMPYNEFD